MHVRRRGLRMFGANVPRLFSLLAVVALVGGPPRWVTAAESVERAHVRVTVNDAAGNEVAVLSSAVGWNESAVMTLKVGSREHKVSFALKRDDAESFKMGVRYARDGKTVVNASEVDGKLTEPRRIDSADGSASVVFVVENQAGERKKLEVTGSDDPLSGM